MNNGLGGWCASLDLSYKETFMKRAIALGTLVGMVVSTLFVGGPSFAGVNNLPCFALHTRTPPAKPGAICGVADPVTEGVPCDTYSLSASLNTPTLVYMVVGNVTGDGVIGVSFGVDYNFGQGIVWHECYDGLAFTNDGGNGEFPAPAGGLRATWYSCQNTVVGASGVQAVIGALYFYAYADDVVEVTPNNNIVTGAELDVSLCASPTIRILDELAAMPEQIPLTLGKVQFGAGSAGFTPCQSTPVERTTWGKLKTLYGKRD
jgi:hypothetical protein